MDVGGPSCPWGEALLLTESLRRDTSTFLGAAEAGWSRPAQFGDVSTALLAVAVSRLLSEKASSKLGLLFPWTPVNDNEPAPAEVVDKMKERMLQYSAFGAD